MNNIYNVRLAGMETTSVSIIEKPKDFTGKKFNFDMSSAASVNAERSLFLLKISVVVREDNKPEHIGQVSVIYAYEVKDFHAFIKPDEQGQYDVPSDLEEQLRVISLSTTRGVMHAYFKNTYLQGATLPIIGDVRMFNQPE